ncbi:Methyltransferase domain-containing protein [Rhizobiales bacterium GAS191]|nr:Methyltransferase domain-containing protein [Rhizobiales bacterium GAS113]SEE62510.1 Methyltransferase domain-containing protein [Rhizobiales bacterium GAS191]
MSADHVPWESNFYDPALYDASAGDADSAATVAYYRAQLTGASRQVLDIGCGTGRLALMLIEDGHRVHGLDTSAAMLSHLQAKAAPLPREARNRLDWQLEDFLEAAPVGEFDALIAADDFVTHFDLAALDRFFIRAREWLRPDGVLLTDMRERDAARLAAACAPFPKPVQTHGLVGGIATDSGSRHAAMMGWEEYNSDSRRLISHQIYCFIRPDGSEEKRVWKTICQRNHTNAELIDAASRAGFVVQQSIGRQDPTAIGNQGGFFRMLRK